MRVLHVGQIGNEKTIAFAVSELKRLLLEMDPELSIDVIEKPYLPESKGVLWVGMDPAFGIPEDPAVDTIRIEVKDLSGFIAGSNPRSVLIAVYRFLKEAGCRFVRPGRSGEKIPKRSDWVFSVQVKETASYPHRGVCIEGADSYDNILDMIDFLPKVGMNEYFVQFQVPTEFFVRWYEHRGSTVLKPEGRSAQEARWISEGMTASLETEIKKRGLCYHKVGHGWTCEPFGIDGSGWFTQQKPLTEEQISILAEVNGKREMWGGVPLNTNLCYSQEKVREKITDAITAYAKANPQVDVVHFWLADGSNNHCECPECQKRLPADWYVLMLNELDRKMSAEGLQTKVVFLIYVDLLWEPKTEKIENPDRFILMFAPITREYGKNYSDFLTFDGQIPAYERNHLKMPRSLAQNIEHLRRWQKEFKGDSFDFDYHLMWAHVGDIGYEKCAKNLFQDMKDLHAIGLEGMVSCQIQRVFYPTAMPFLAMAAALWDEKADYEKLAEEYYSAAFGKGGQKVREAMELLSESCHLYDDPMKVYQGEMKPVEKEKVLKASGMLLEVAGEMGDAPEAEELRLYTEYLERLLALFGKLEEKEPAGIKEAGEILLQWMWEHELALQGILDVQNSINVIRRLLPKE